jgi:hypothetical protein
MILKKNERVSITGRDEVVFSIVLYMLDLTLHPRAPVRTSVKSAIHYFRDLGLPVDYWLFDRITAAWDTRLAWGTPTARIAFPMDDHDPGDGCEIINRGRRRQIWHSISSAVGREADVAAPPWVMNTPRIGSGLLTGDAMLQVMAEVIGDELLDRLSDRGGTKPEQPGTSATPTTNRPRSDPIRDVIERLEIEFKDDPEVEFGFRQ